jgi:tetratricopeptide (TPR) repeat protein
MGRTEHVLITTAREHQRAGRFDEARALYRSVLSDDPDHPEAILGLADLLEVRGESAALVRLLEEAIARRGDRARLHARLGDARHGSGDLPGAIAAYHRCLGLDPDDGGALWGLGCAEAARDDHAAARERFGRLTAVQPRNGLAWHNLGRSLYELGEVDDALRSFRAAVAHLPPDMGCMPLGNIAVTIPGAASASPREILEARRAWASHCLPPPVARAAGTAADDDPDRPIRLGYVSAFFDKRNWMKPVWGLLNAHDRDRFEVHLFSDGPEAAIGPGLQRDPRDRFHEVAALNNPALARRIADLRIDVLVDLNGYSRPARLPLFALRPAPAQVAWFNMYGTSGVPGLDDLIGDDHVILPGEEALYTERVVRVPGSYLTFEVAYPAPEVTPPPCLAAGTLTFGCLAPQYKITPEVVAAWSEILAAVPSARLLLKSTALGKSSARDFVRGRFARHGVPAERLLLEGPAEHHAFLGRYAAVDVALDTFPYNGGTTTMEALWQGVPVLTFQGDRWAARISASLLREAGLGEFVAADPEAFLRAAIDLGRDPETPGRLAELRRTMRDRLGAASVCQVARFAREMERIYVEILGDRGRPV